MAAACAGGPIACGGGFTQWDWLCACTAAVGAGGPAGCGGATVEGKAGCPNGWFDGKVGDGTFCDIGSL